MPQGQDLLILFTKKQRRARGHQLGDFLEIPRSNDRPLAVVVARANIEHVKYMNRHNVCFIVPPKQGAEAEASAAEAAPVPARIELGINNLNERPVETEAPAELTAEALAELLMVV
jgi:hypothetical protein